MLLEAGVFPRIVMEMDHLGAVSSMVRAGLGLAVVPRWAVLDDVNAGRLVGLSIGKTGLYRAWGLGSARRRPSAADAARVRAPVPRAAAGLAGGVSAAPRCTVSRGGTARGGARRAAAGRRRRRADPGGGAQLVERLGDLVHELARSGI